MKDISGMFSIAGTKPIEQICFPVLYSKYSKYNQKGNRNDARWFYREQWRNNSTGEPVIPPFTAHTKSKIYEWEEIPTTSRRPATVVIAVEVIEQIVCLKATSSEADETLNAGLMATLVIKSYPCCNRRPPKGLDALALEKNGFITRNNFIKAIM